jgi:hypothetical protein
MITATRMSGKILNMHGVALILLSQMSACEWHKVVWGGLHLNAPVCRTCGKLSIMMLTLKMDAAMSLPTEKQVQYRWLDNDIHEFILFDFTRAGVDDFLAKIDAANHSPNLGAPMLVDSQRGILPVNYFFTRLRVLNNTSPRPDKPFKTAVIQHSGFLATVVQTLVKAFPQTQVQFFNADERDKALAWLRKPLA